MERWTDRGTDWDFWQPQWLINITVRSMAVPSILFVRTRWEPEAQSKTRELSKTRLSLSQLLSIGLPTVLKVSPERWLGATATHHLKGFLPRAINLIQEALFRINQSLSTQTPVSSSTPSVQLTVISPPPAGWFILYFFAIFDRCLSTIRSIVLHLYLVKDNVFCHFHGFKRHCAADLFTSAKPMSV